MTLDLRLKTKADVRRFTATITAFVLVIVPIWNYLFLPPEVFELVIVSNLSVSFALCSTIAYFVGSKMLLIEKLTADLEQAAHRDHLTGLMSRARFYQRCRQEEEAFFPGSLLIMDIDHFKTVNDRYGHDAGDKALKHVAAIVMRNCRASDLVARFGGEEFLLLLPDAGEAQGAAAAERIREKLAKAPVQLGRGDVPVTASFGVAEVTAATDLDETVRRADAALYRAKENGRNRVCRAYTPDTGELQTARRPGGVAHGSAA